MSFVLEYSYNNLTAVVDISSYMKGTLIMGKITTRIASAVLLIAVTALVTYQITYGAVEKKYSETVYTIADEESPYTKLNAIDEIVRKTYVHEIDETELEEGLIYGYLYGIGDKYASYLDSEEYKAYTNETNGEQVGLGVSVIYDSTLGGIYIISVNENSPAMEAGLRAGDIIYAVDDVTVAERGYYSTLSYIAKGKAGDKVKISVRKDGDPLVTEDYEIAKAIIESKTVEYELYGGSVGYVSISSFDMPTSNDFIAAMEDLKAQGATCYVFDVRYNSGGALDSISKILDYLLPEGPIIRIYEKDSGESVISSDANCVDAPMAVLVNENTASAAELFASALRDYDKAKLIGITTYGKGTMQTLLPLPPGIGGGALSISTGMYNPPISDNYEDVGLSPDIEIELPPEQEEIFYMLPLSEDVQFQEALKTVVNVDTLVFAPSPEITEDEVADGSIEENE